jgi:hypothetical protein
MPKGKKAKTATAAKTAGRKTTRRGRGTAATTTVRKGPARRGRPPKAVTTPVKKKRARRGSGLAKALERERRVRRRWKAASVAARKELAALKKVLAGLEKRQRAEERYARTRAQALAAFEAKWEKRYAKKLARLEAKPVRRRRKRRAA